MRKRIAALVLVAATTTAAAASGQACKSDWHQFRRDTRHAGVNPAETALSPSTVPDLEQIWAFETGGLVTASVESDARPEDVLVEPTSVPTVVTRVGSVGPCKRDVGVDGPLDGAEVDPALLDVEAVHEPTLGLRLPWVLTRDDLTVVRPRHVREAATGSRAVRVRDRHPVVVALERDVTAPEHLVRRARRG